MIDAVVKTLRLRYLRNSSGEEDGSWSLCVAGFVIVSFCMVAPMFKGIVIGSTTLEIVAPDTTLLLGYLATTVGNYLMRRNKKDSLQVEREKVETQEPAAE